MRSFLAALCMGIITVNGAFAQNNSGQEEKLQKKTVAKPAKDHFMFQLSHDRWSNVPDSVSLRNAGRGVGIYLLNDFPIKKSNFSFAAGIGVRFNNIYFNNQRMVLNSGTDKINFVNIDSSIYKGQKFVNTYLEAPLELRYFGNRLNRNKGFKLAVGAKIGYQGVGGAFYRERESVAGKYINYKTVTKRYNQQWRLSPTIRMGWGNFSVFGEYTVTPIFDAATGLDIRPFAMGIVISGL